MSVRVVAGGYLHTAAVAPAMYLASFLAAAHDRASGHDVLRDNSFTAYATSGRSDAK